MKFTALHSDIAPAVALAARIVPSRAIRPVLSAVRIYADGDGVTVSAADMETARVCTLPATVRESGCAVIPARHLSELLRRIPGGEIGCSLDGHNLVLGWGSSRHVMHGFDAADFPAIADAPNVLSTVPASVVLHAIEHATFAAADGDTARALLTGVELRIGAEALFALATDGFQVASYCSQPGAERPEESIVVPATALDELARSLGNTDAPVEIGHDGRMIHFTCGNTRLSTRLLEGKYFAVLDLVPKEFPSRIHLRREAFAEAVRRVGLVTEGDAPYPVTLSGEGSAIELQATAADVGIANEQMSAEVEGTAVRVTFNARQLAGGLARFHGDSVTMEISGENTLARVVDGDGRLQFLQMPLQMPEDN